MVRKSFGIVWSYSETLEILEQFATLIQFRRFDGPARDGEDQWRRQPQKSGGSEPCFFAGEQ